MLYADYLVLLAESEQDLQTQMNSLGTYANIFQMEVNQKKTKITNVWKVTEARKTYLKNMNDRWHKYWRRQILQMFRCNFYKGRVIYWLELVNGLKYSIIAKCKEWQGFDPKTAFFHIFGHTILPILNYGAEVCRGKDWTELEKLHLSACKYILGVSHSTPTDGIYAEL